MQRDIHPRLLMSRFLRVLAVCGLAWLGGCAGSEAPPFRISDAWLNTLGQNGAISLHFSPFSEAASAPDEVEAVSKAFRVAAEARGLRIAPDGIEISVSLILLLKRSMGNVPAPPPGVADVLWYKSYREFDEYNASCGPIIYYSDRRKTKIRMVHIYFSWLKETNVSSYVRRCFDSILTEGSNVVD
ncbi:MAG: hypothetical protein EPN20_16655 [Magnetospirillum sp.]|nr:MAG: hypothetical protein EPN20_16655 [Magnetospirillum sp.]